jgi:hypothetical protein
MSRQFNGAGASFRSILLLDLRAFEITELLPGELDSGVAGT